MATDEKLGEILEKFPFRSVPPAELLKRGISPVVIVGMIGDDEEKTHRLATEHLPVEEKKNSYIWEMVYSEENISADAPNGTTIFNGTLPGKYVLLDDCDAWGYEVIRQSGGAGVATVDTRRYGSFDGTEWYSSAQDTNITKAGNVFSHPGASLTYGGKYGTILVKVNTQGADLFRVRLWRRRKQ